MIKYTVQCDQGHQFEGWYPSSDAFDTMKAAGELICAHCDSHNIQKSIMAPSVARSGALTPSNAQRLDPSTFRDVGTNFVHEARTTDDPIRGQARFEDAVKLASEGYTIGVFNPTGPKLN
ncbi:MAG: DUF1178 family protein [Alphaproteobacteria bacterium]